jgi:prefoldin alpha subunit
MTENQNNGIREELEFLESYIGSSERQISLLTQGIEDYGKALGVLQSAEISHSSETLISLGGGVFAKGKVERTEPLLVAIGADLFIEENADETIKRLSTQIEEVRKSVDNLNAQRAEAIRRYEAIVKAVNSNENQDVPKR